MRLIRLVSAAVVLAGALISTQATAVPAYAGPELPGIGWQYSEEGKGYYREPQSGESGGGGGGPALTMTEVGIPSQVCVDAPNRQCNGFHSLTCGLGIGPNNRPWYAHLNYRRTDAGAPWVYESNDCIEVTDEDWISLEEISYRVDFEVFQPLGEPNLDLSPAPKGLVNLPVVVSTDYPEGLTGPAQIISLDPVRVRIPIHIDRPRGGLDGEILADGSYTWQFEGGGTAVGRGKPYTRSVDPTRDGGYYVSEIFRTTGPKNVHLEVQWTGTVTVAGLAPEPIEPVDIDADATVNVVESRPVLKR